MGSGVEARFEAYCDGIVKALGHADRVTPARWYLRGLMLPGERKSIEPMAARVHPQDVCSAHQSMHHLVADSDWSDKAVCEAVAQQVLPVLTQGAPCFWIVDDTAMRKYGSHSVGVARQYCGQLGKVDNCQIAVSLSLATAVGSLPLAYRLYLPREWAEDQARYKRAGVPPEIGYASKGEIAWGQIEAALAAGMPRGIVLMDAGYEDAALRDRLTAHGLQYAAGIRPPALLWWGRHQRMRAVQIARALPQRSYRTVTWREGTKTDLASRFARVRVRAAQGGRMRAEEWLLIEWPEGETEPTKYFLSTLPANVSFKALVDTVKMRWRIERDYLELKQELGLGHYEGRNWRGFHHHASLCIAAYGFLMLERLSGFKKNAARLKVPALPNSFRPRGARPDAAAHSVVDRDRAVSSGACDRSASVAMSVLW